MKKLVSFLLILVISLNIFCITSFADTPTYITDTEPTPSQIISEVCSHNGFNYYDWDYYILAGNTTTDGWGTKSRYFYVALVDPASDSDIHIINDNYDENHEAMPFKITSDVQESKGVLISAFEVRDAAEGQSWDIYVGFGFNNLSNVSNDFLFSYASDSKILYASNMSVYVGDENVNRHDYTAEITYDGDSNKLLYQFWNHSDGLTFGVKCGIYDYTDFGMVSVDDGLYWGYSVDLQTVIDWAEDHDLDYLNMVAYMTIYDGINAVETVTCTISEALSGAEEEDGMFDEEKEYEEFPDPSDYFSDPPDFPDLAPTPSFPGFDPEHPIDSIAEIIRWLASVVVTWIQNVIEIVKWINATIVYYLANGFLFLKDCFLTLVHNIGIALYNLVVKLRALITHLALPTKESLKERFNDVFPIFGQFKALFTSWGGGNQTITITLLGETATINAVECLGAGACNVFYNLSTLMIGATTAFALFNIITSIFGITLGRHGGDE